MTKRVDSRRESILAFLKTRGHATLGEVAAHLEVSKQGALRHLEALEADGLATVAHAEPHGRGRPENVYQLTPAAGDLYYHTAVSPGGKYALVTRDMGQGVRMDVFDVTTGDKLFECWGYLAEFLGDGALPADLHAHVALTWLRATFLDAFATGAPPLPVAAGNRLPGVPPQRNIAAADIPIPVQMVCTSGLMYCIAS